MMALWTKEIDPHGGSGGHDIPKEQHCGGYHNALRGMDEGKRHNMCLRRLESANS
jgi:hypothetical protein